MPAAAPILVSGGLVETRDPTLFQPGEMSKTQDAYYKPNNPALWSVLGNAVFNDTPIDPIVGLRYLEYDGFDNIILAHVGDEILEAVAASTGTFVSKVTGLTATGVKTVDSCHYNNNHLIFDGVNRNRVRDKNGIYRFQGMLANTDAPVYANTGAGSGFVLASGTTLTYWIEEQVRDGAGVILRRNASPSLAQTVTVTGSGAIIKPRISRPTQINSDATHWAIYVTGVNGLFPIGVSLGSATIATLFIDDPRGATALPPLQGATGTGISGAILQLLNQMQQQQFAAQQLIPLATGLPKGDIYETVAVSLDNLVQIYPKNGPPPISASADVMEDSILMDDMTDRTKVWFTFPDNIDSVPYTNFIRFETKDADEVQWSRFLGRGAIVALSGSLWRIDTLPQPSDASFQIARVKVQIEGATGGIGKLTVAPFSLGEEDLLAYVSPEIGICRTNGETWSILSGDIDWDRIDVSMLESATLVDNPKEFRLEFTYTPVGGVLNSEMFFLHYHPSHAKPGQSGEQLAKITGPILRGGRVMTQAKISGRTVIISGQSDGKIYREWTGLTNLRGSIEFDILTGEKHPGGVGKQARCNRLWVHHQAAGTDAVPQRAECYVIQRTEGLDDVTEVRDFPMKRREHTAIYPDVEGEAFEFGIRVTNPTAQIAIDFFVPDFDDLGESTADGEA